MNGWFALAAGLVTVTLWGSAFVGIQAAGLSPGPLALGRLLVSLVVLGIAMLVRREPRPALRDLPRIAAFGVLFLRDWRWPAERCALPAWCWHDAAPRRLRRRWREFVMA